MLILLVIPEFCNTCYTSYTIYLPCYISCVLLVPTVLASCMCILSLLILAQPLRSVCPSYLSCIHLYPYSSPRPVYVHNPFYRHQWCVGLYSGFIMAKLHQQNVLSSPAPTKQAYWLFRLPNCIPNIQH